MEISSADFCKLSLQEVADFLLDHDSNGAVCKGVVDGKSQCFQNLIHKGSILGYGAFLKPCEDAGVG